MSPRTGRPTDDPKNFRLELRLSEADKKLLEYCCEKTKLSKAEVIRLGIREVYKKIK